MAHAVSEVGVVVPAAVPEEASKSATSWGALIAGGVAAAAATLVLMLVGAGLGLTMVSPFSNEGISLETVAASTAIWLMVVQWLSALLGGYIAGRLRTKWVNLHTDEVLFRDTAHGFLAWALATLLVAGLLSSTISAMIGTGVQATSTVCRRCRDGRSRSGRIRRGQYRGLFRRRAAPARRSGETGWRSGLCRSFADPAGERRVWRDGRR
jgi:hypothetical protein